MPAAPTRSRTQQRNYGTPWQSVPAWGSLGGQTFLHPQLCVKAFSGALLKGGRRANWRQAQSGYRNNPKISKTRATANFDYLAVRPPVCSGLGTYGFSKPADNTEPRAGTTPLGTAPQCESKRCHYHFFLRGPGEGDR